MGCGANPNLFNVFERNHFTEGNTSVNYNTARGSSYNFGGGYVLASTSGGTANGAPSRGGFEQLSMNSFTVFRQNRIDSNGGILVEDDSADILVECELPFSFFSCSVHFVRNSQDRIADESTSKQRINLTLFSFRFAANSIEQSDLQICITNTTRNVFLRDNDAQTVCAFTKLDSVQ